MPQTKNKKSNHKVKIVDNLIFTSAKLNIRGGGPVGYLANLKLGLEKYGADNIVLVCRDDDTVSPYKKLVKYLTIVIPFKKARKKARAYLFDRLNKNSIWYFSDVAQDNYASFVKKLDNFLPKTIICHWVRDALFIKKYIDYRKLDSKIILMSHSPEPPSQEIYHGEKLANDTNAERNLKIWEGIEEKAFRLADMLLFPSQEATEPYTSALPYFEELIQNKKMLYLNTGCKSLYTDKTKEELRRKYNIKTPFVICFIGRHTQIKGYDVLKNIAQNILSQRDDVTFLIGGMIGNEITPLSHPNWVELGFVDPSEVLKISDLFILPNRQTYFDLILLETLSAGCPVLASATGGNKSVYKTINHKNEAGWHAVELWKNSTECEEKIIDFLTLSQQHRDELKTQAYEAYQKYYTVDVFAKNYIKMIEEITNDAA